MNTDGNEIVINPLAVTKPEPSGEVEVHKGPKALSDKDLQAYAESTGQEVIKLKSIAQTAVLGELAQRLGTEKIGNAMLLRNQDMILDGIKECTEMCQEYAHEPKIVGTLMKVKATLIGEWNRAAHTFIKSKRDSGPDESQEKPHNIPPPPLVPVQINITGNSVSTDKPIN